MNTFLYRTLHPEIKVLDAKQGLVEYVASDETIDSFKEIIRADGWRFNNFKKNAPFVDSHDYNSIDKLLGEVVDFKVAGRKLVETVRWAKGIGSKLADIGWKLTEAGYLKAVSVGFWPTAFVGKGDKEYQGQLNDLGLAPDAEVRTIFTEQEQIELSAVILGANPNALIARSYKEGILTDADLETISTETAKREIVSRAFDPAAAHLTRLRAREQAALDRIARAINQQ